MGRPENRMQRLGEALRVLDAQGGRGRRLEVWHSVRDELPLEGEELELNSKRRPHGESDFLWGTTALVRAGFMEKRNRGEWVLTDAGREAGQLGREDFAHALHERQRAFQRVQSADRELRLRSEIVPPDTRAETIRAPWGPRH